MARKPARWGWKLVAAAAVLIFVAGGVVWNFYWRGLTIEPASKEKMALPLPDKPSIAVLPFVNMSGDPNQDFLADAITDQIIAVLAMSQSLFVIARNTVFTYKGKFTKIQQVAEELGVKYVLEGSVQSFENRLRITAQLIDALSGKHLWAERYNRDRRDLSAILDEITAKIHIENFM